MNICLVGGIFDRDETLRTKCALTPETILLEGLRNSGISIHAVGHAKFQLSDEYDIVHVHHVGRAAYMMAAADRRAGFIFTGHNGAIVTGYERSWLRKRAFQYVIDKADAVVALSHTEAKYFRQAGVGSKVHVIPNGIPPSVFVRPVSLNSGERQRRDSLNILYVGQLIDLKGVDVLLKAFQKVHDHWNVTLRLVYHNAYRESDYRRLVRELAIDSNVVFVGLLGPADLANEYQRADLLVLSSFAECLPSVVTEALLSGTPVVACAVCGVPEQVGHFGKLVPPGDIAALATAIESVLRDRRRFQAMAEDMRAYAEDKYNPTTMVRAHLTLYDEVLRAEPHPVNCCRAEWLDRPVRLATRIYWPHAH